MTRHKQNFGGAFFIPEFGWLPNRFQQEGMELFLQIIFQGNDVEIPIADGEIFVGMCGNAATGVGATMADITDEVPIANGYGRIGLGRNATDWPSIATVNNRVRVTSKELEWTAVDDDFQSSFTRLFLTTEETGTEGLLLSISAPLTVPYLLVEDATFNSFYSFYLAG